MRELGYLVRLYPEKTGEELMAIQEQEKLEDQKKYEKTNQKKLAFIKDINTNGGYFRGKFGLDQYYYYNVSNMVMDDRGDIRMDVEKIVVFINEMGHKHTVTDKGRINIEKEIETYQDFSTYSLENEERVTVKEWKAINKYITAITKFWM